MCHGLCLCAKDLPVHSAMLPVHLFFGLPLLLMPSTVTCSISLVRPSDLVAGIHHFSFRRFIVARRSSSDPITLCFVMVLRTWVDTSRLLASHNYNTPTAGRRGATLSATYLGGHLTFTSNHRHADRQTDRQTDRQDRQTDRQTDRTVI